MCVVCIYFADVGSAAGWSGLWKWSCEGVEGCGWGLGSGGSECIDAGVVCGVWLLCSEWNVAILVRSENGC